MEIHIVSTPEIENRIISGVFDLLTSSGKGIRFVSATQFTTDQLSRIDPIFKEPVVPALDFDTLLNVCDKYRFKSDIKDDVFVTLLSEYRNDMNWFSAVKGRNLFVDVNDWEEITGKNDVLGISFQVIENVFQSLLGINYDTISEDSKYIHFKPKGCINDFCETKEDVILKLKTADICESCIAKAEELHIHNQTLSSIQSILENIRLHVKTLNVLNEIEPEKIKIDKNFNITIGEKKIILEPLQKTLFVFFVTNGVVPISELSNNIDAVYSIYQKIRPSAFKKTIENMFDSQIATPLFLKTKSTLNAELIRQIGKPLADYYTVILENRVNYRVRITPNYLDERPEY